MLRVSQHLLRFEEHGLLLGWGLVWCIPGVSARVWFGSGIPPTLSVVGIRSALSPPLRSSSSPVLRSEYVYSRCCSVSLCMLVWAWSLRISSNRAMSIEKSRQSCGTRPETLALRSNGEAEIKKIPHLVRVIWLINKNSKSYKPKLWLSIWI